MHKGKNHQIEQSQGQFLVYQAAAEIIHSRVDADKPDLGLTNYRGTKVHKQDVAIAKNYLDEFFQLYNTASRQCRTATWTEDNPVGRWRCYDYEELIASNKARLDIFLLKDGSLEDSDNLPESGVLAAEIVEDLQVALAQFRGISVDLGGDEVVAE